KDRRQHGCEGQPGYAYRFATFLPPVWSQRFSVVPRAMLHIRWLGQAGRSAQFRTDGRIIGQPAATLIADAQVLGRLSRDFVSVVQSGNKFRHVVAFHAPSFLAGRVACHTIRNSSRAVKSRDRTVPTGMSRIWASSA